MKLLERGIIVERGLRPLSLRTPLFRWVKSEIQWKYIYLNEGYSRKSAKCRQCPCIQI
jgi:histone deacetylase complex regulatory component SIN3